MSFFNWEKPKEKQWAITVDAGIVGTFYVDRKGINVCCSADSSRSNGYNYEAVWISMQNLKRLYPGRKYDIVEI